MLASEITFAEMTDYWGLANGFSHQIVQIYVDQGETTYGQTEMLDGAYAEVHPDWAWEVAISATGEPGAVKTVSASTGETSAKGIEVIQIRIKKDRHHHRIEEYHR